MNQSEAKRSPITGIKRHVVESSNIAEIGHDELSGVIEIRFKTGAVWQYPGKFDRHTFEAFRDAESVGKFFRQYIYPRIHRQDHVLVSQNEDETVRQIKAQES
jgi:hypothetical protein